MFKSEGIHLPQHDACIEINLHLVAMVAKLINIDDRRRPLLPKSLLERDKCIASSSESFQKVDVDVDVDVATKAVAVAVLKV